PRSARRPAGPQPRDGLQRALPRHGQRATVRRHRGRRVRPVHRRPLLRAGPLRGRRARHQDRVGRGRSGAPAGAAGARRDPSLSLPEPRQAFAAARSPASRVGARRRAPARARRRRADELPPRAGRRARPRLAEPRAAGRPYAEQAALTPQIRPPGTVNVYYRTYATRDAALAIACGSPALRRAFIRAVGLSDDALDRPIVDRPKEVEHYLALRRRVE